MVSILQDVRLNGLTDVVGLMRSERSVRIVDAHVIRPNGKKMNRDKAVITKHALWSKMEKNTDKIAI